MVVRKVRKAEETEMCKGWQRNMAKKRERMYEKDRKGRKEERNDDRMVR
jgi:hypothetical protein